MSLPRGDTARTQLTEIAYHGFFSIPYVRGYLPLGFLHRLLTDRWKKLGLAKEVRNRWIGGAGSRGIRSRRRRPLKGPGKAFPVCRSGAGQIEVLGLTRQQAEAFGERTGGYASCKCPL